MIRSLATASWQESVPAAMLVVEGFKFHPPTP
jgi:hypothetical protein